MRWWAKHFAPHGILSFFWRVFLFLVLFMESFQVVAQLTKDWRIPEQILPVKSIAEHPTIRAFLQKYTYITLHVPAGYYPNAFFLFIHTPKSGGTTFNTRSCPSQLKRCGATCGCGNCNMPTFFSGDDFRKGVKYPVVSSFMNSSCPLLSFEINYKGFQYAFHNPAPPKSRNLYAITFLREPYSYIRSQVAHFLARHRKSWSDGDRSPLTLQCLDARQHFNRSSGCNKYHLNNGQTHWLAEGDLQKGITVIRSMFGIGVTEFHEESMCIFQFQLGQFDRKRCNCKYLRAAKKQKTAKIWSSSNSTFDFESDTSIQELMTNNTRVDQNLWAEGMKIFSHRLRFVEHQTGVRLACREQAEKISKFYYEMQG